LVVNPRIKTTIKSLIITMAKKITRFQKFVMHNPFLQFFMFLFLNVKILYVVALGHGGTREK
jgi:hypothetical protein